MLRVIGQIKLCVNFNAKVTTTVNRSDIPSLRRWVSDRSELINWNNHLGVAPQREQYTANSVAAYRSLDG